MTHEEVPLAAVFREILAFVAGRADVVLHGAHAVNAYCEPPRMTHDMDLLTTRASAVSAELATRLSERLRIATRVREVVPGRGFRVHQVRKPTNRRLVDVRPVEALPPSRTFEDVRVILPPGLVAMKVLSLVRRAGQPKAGTDLVDVQRLLLAFPDLKTAEGAVAAELRRREASAADLARWREIVATPIEPDQDEGW